MSSQTPRLATGTVLGRYRLEQLLGTGGMASVWKARDERLGRSVAVKILSETLALDRGYVDRFEREAQTAARLSHPNLVPVFDYGTREGRPYLVSEYIDGGTIADRIGAGTSIDAGALARQLLGALEHIHAAGVIHRDVKPANILVDREGHSRLTDFGVAQPSDAAPLTETGKVLGTLGYMAPEVSAGEPASERSDLYSAGIVLSEVIDGPGTAATELAPLVSRLTAEDPSLRPVSATEALGLLEEDPDATALAVTAPLTATPTSPTAVRGTDTPPPPGGPRSNRRRLLAAALVTAAVVGFAIAALAGGDEEGPSQSEADRTPRPRQVTDTVTVAPEPVTTTVPATATQPASDPCADPEAWTEYAEQLDKESKKLVEEQLKECEKEAEGGPEGEGPPGQLKKSDEED